MLGKKCFLKNGNSDGNSDGNSAMTPRRGGAVLKDS